MGDESRVFGEPQNNRSLGVFANHNYNVIIGSDVKDWTKYQDSTFAELKLPVDSFRQFCLLSKKDKTVVDTLLNKKQSYELVAQPHASVSFKLKIFRDVNIVFGQKGTGKTEIIKSLCSSMTSLGIMLMYGKEASNRKQEIDRQHYTIPNQRPKDKHCGKI